MLCLTDGAVFVVLGLVSRVQYATGKADEPRIRVMCLKHIACLPEGTVIEWLRDGRLGKPRTLIRGREARERQLRAAGMAVTNVHYVRVYTCATMAKRYLAGEFNAAYADGYERLVDELIRLSISSPEMFAND